MPPPGIERLYRIDKICVILIRFVQVVSDEIVRHPVPFLRGENGTVARGVGDRQLFLLSATLRLPFPFNRLIDFRLWRGRYRFQCSV
jgi:hypothetical protein